MYSRAVTTAAQLAIGSTFGGDFKIIRRLSQGAMGGVWIVEQLSVGKQRALKVMHTELVADEKLRGRFVQEAKIGGKIESDHIVEVVAAGVDVETQMPWLAMELLKGETLGERWKHGPLEPKVIAEVFTQLGHALGAAHAAGIVHRDLKPDNIFLAAPRRTGVAFTVKVLDFGIAKLVLESSTKSGQTESIGTPMWMAPEQSQESGKIRPSTDVFSLGLIAYALLTGLSYWNALNTEGSGPIQLMREIIIDPIEPASTRAAKYDVGARLPADFDVWFLRACAREPTERFPDAREAIDALLPLLGGAPSPVAIDTASTMRAPVLSQPGDIQLASTEAAPKAGSKRTLWLVLALVVIAGGVVSGVLITRSGRGGKNRQTEPRTQTSASADEASSDDPEGDDPAPDESASPSASSGN